MFTLQLRRGKMKNDGLENLKKNDELPKTSMRKTTQAYCRKCGYSSIIYANTVACSYFLITGERRGCEVGYCDKFAKRNGRKRIKAMKVKRK